MLRSTGTLRLIVVATALMSCSISAFSAIVGGQAATITALYTYPQYGGGDVVITVSPSLPGCESGFWANPSDPGFKSVYAQLLVAWITQSVIRVWAYDDQIWSGASGSTCRIEALRGNPP